MQSVYVVEIHPHYLVHREVLSDHYHTVNNNYLVRNCYY